MKLVVSLFLLSILLLSCQTSTEPTEPQAGASSDVQPSPSEPNAESIAGGETQQAVDSPEALAMRSNAENLLNQKYSGAGISLGKITSFSTQVVAGINFRLEVAYTNQSGASGTLMVTIYRDLDDNSTLTEDNYPDPKK